METLIESLGINALFCKSEGITAEQTCEFNLEFLKKFGISEEQSFEIVEIWKNECIKYGIFNDKK